MAIFPTRVVALGPTTSAYSFTMFKAPGMPDELFESQYESLRREFEQHPPSLRPRACELRPMTDELERREGPLMCEIDLVAERASWPAPITLDALQHLVNTAEREDSCAPAQRGTGVAEDR